jgi:hypothetical protein
VNEVINRLERQIREGEGGNGRAALHADSARGGGS